MTGPQRIRTKLSGEAAAVPQPAASVPPAWRLKPPSMKSLQLGDSIPVILIEIRQVGNMENCFFVLGNRKASCLSCSRLKPKHIVWYVWAHTGHKAVIILVLPYVNSLKLRPMPRWVLRKLKAVTNAPDKPDTRMQSLSMRTPILNSTSLKIAVGEIHTWVPGQRGLRWSSRIGQQL